MTDVTPVGQGGGTSPTDPSNDPAASQLQQAFSDGVVKFMGMELQSSENDTISAINDDTSNPDAPS